MSPEILITEFKKCQRNKHICSVKLETHSQTNATHTAAEARTTIARGKHYCNTEYVNNDNSIQLPTTLVRSSTMITQPFLTTVMTTNRPPPLTAGN